AASAALAAGLIVASLASASLGLAQRAPCGMSSAIAADLTGNGTREHVQLRIVGGAGRCYGFLRATIGGKEIATRITLPKGAEPQTLALIGSRDVNTAAGAELIVRIWRGASTDFFRIYTLDHGAFAAMHVPRTSMPSADAFPFGGALGSDDTVSCAGPGLVIYSAASLIAKRWTVHRTWYRASATAFNLSHSATVRVSRLNSLSEFRIDAPFATCR
ncbi:MAG TPA: hypothetical protein VN770_09625, partial [Gaiellaceae bacterium]|nr:hypothetical protein [Gaiellaceae bacterium]